MRSVSTARGRRRLAAKLARKTRAKGWHDNKPNIAAFFAPSIAFAFYSTAAAAAGTNVAPDGRTQTQLTTVGSVTDVTTSTIHNGNAINSFSQFQVGQGDTVNLQVPDSAQRLLNVVHDGPVNVDGVVNGYKDGKIGGDVYFADPYGFVVGKMGSVNVGSLTVRTPTKDATEKLIDQNGNVDDASVSGVIDGTLPVSPDGSVVIRGKINTVGGARIAGQTVDTTAGPADATAFNASVNTSGLKQGGNIRATNGDIEITAAGDASIGGTISADGTTNQSAGHIAITAGNDSALDKTANISAKGVGTASNGGNIKVYAGHNLNVASGAKADVSGGKTGNGGTIELSAADTANFSSATFNAGATSGLAGSIIIDPTTVVIGPTTAVDVGTTSQPSIDTNGGSVTITASDSIVLEAGAFINTRQTGTTSVVSANDSTDLSKGNSGAVTLTSRHITIDGTINTSVINDTSHNYTAGDVSLIASDSVTQNEGEVDVGTSIDIYGTILGGNIDVESNAQAYSEMNTLDQVASSLVSSLFGAGIGLVDARATAAINIYSGANIRGAGDVTFNSWTIATASDPVLIGPVSSIVGTIGFVPSVMVGNVTAKATAAVASGATVTSGGTLTVRAHNDATLDVSQLTVTGNVPIDVSVAYTTADVEANATVAEGATIAAQNAHVTARNDDSFDTSVSVVALGTAAAGVSVAIADGYTTEANAHFGASLSAMLDDPNTTTVDESQTPANSLTVEAESMTTKDAVESSTTVGAGLIVRFFTAPVADALAAVKSKFASVFDKINKIKFGASIALTLDETHTADATIGGDAAHAPTIRANQVAVVANTLDQGVRSSAASATNSPKVSDATAANPTAVISVSAAVAYADRTINTNATIGSGAVIDAQRVGLYSNTDLPVTITWLTGDDFETVMSHINGTLGTANDVLTSYTNATGDAGAYGINGSVNLFNVTANTKSFIGDGAAVNVTGAVAGSWSPTLDTAEDNSHGIDPRSDPLPAADPVFDQSVSVLASRDIETLNFGGNLSIFLNGAGGTNDDAASVGATYDSINYDGDTIAGIGDQATVTSDKGAEVKAHATDKAINVSPTAGNGGGVAISGMVALYDLDSRVHASIASTAKVSATSLDLTADQIENIGTVAGALMVGNDNSVGGMETTNTILTHVAAYIGDNSQDDTSDSASLIANFTAPTAGVTVTGGTVNLAASETGIVQSLAVSLEVGDDSALGASISVNNINDDVTTSIDNATVDAQNVYLNSNADDTIHTIAMGASGSGDIAFAGSAATANISPSIYATISGGSVVTADDNVGVIAVNNDEIETIAGAGAIGIESGGVGLSVVVNTIDGDTIASISGSTVDANGINGSDSFMVNTGELVSAPDVSSISAPSAYTPDMTEKQKNVSGLAVIATSDQAVAANAGTFGGGTEGAGAILPVTTIIGSNAKAFIQNGSVQANLSQDPKSTTFRVPTLDVRAGNHTYTGDFVVAIAGGGGDSIAAGVGTVKFNDHADAYISGATVGTASQNLSLLGDVDVVANSTQAAATIVLGGAGSMNGGAASLAITLFSADTEAYITGGSLIAAGLTVNATSDNAVNVLDGAAAIGSNGVGGSIAVTINNDTTLGYVGDMTNVENGDVGDQIATTLTLSNADISATTNNDLKSLLIAGAGGYVAGVAAMANVTTLSSTTKAGFYGAEVNQAAGDSKVGGIKVTANENDGVDAKVGGAAVGVTGAGIGIAANVVVLHSSVTGTILGSDINSGSTVDVEALSNKDIDALTVTGAVGFYAGVGAAVGVVLVGTDASSDVAGQLNDGGNGTLSDIDSLAPGNDIADAVNSGSPDAVTASIAGGSMNADTLTIKSQGTVSTDNHSVGAAAGGAGVGGAVSYTDVGDTVVASLDSTSPNAKSVSVTAAVLDGSGRAVDTEAEAGGAGGIGLGAGVAVSKLTNNVGARFVGSATGSNAGDFTLAASDTTSASSLTIGGAAGGFAVGAMVSTASKNSTVSAYTERSLDPLENPTITNYNNVSVTASDAGAVDTSATGVSGGMVAAGNAAVATSDDNANVYATLDDFTSITGTTGLVTVSASDTPDMSADAYGVAVSGGAALGAAAATANIDPTVKASVNDNTTISGTAGLTVNATLQQVAGENSAETSAFSGSGGLYLALNGAVALSTNNSDVEAVTGDTVTLPDGDIGVTATNTASLDAYASGIGVGGLAGGASDAESNTDSTTKATLGSNNKGTSHTGSLTVKAVGNDTDTSHAVAGTYGIVAGNASVAKTSDTADIEALVGYSTALPASSITVLASHQDNYAELADSTEVSVLGASGAEARHNADVTVLTTIDHDVSLIATGGIDITSEDDFNRVGTDDAADAGGGGVLNGAGATSKTNITGSSTVTIDDYVSLIAGDDLLTSPGHINLLADTNLTGNDVISLSTGGALEGAGVENDYDATVDNAVTMGASDTFLTFGNFNAGTYTLSSVSIQALASTWGVLGAIADAEADLSIITNQSVTLGNGSVVEVYGNANLTAGQNPADATATVLNGGAQAESYVRSLIAIPAAHAGTDLTNNTTLTLSPGSIVNAGQNVTVGSFMGQVLPQADGTGHGFELGFIPATNGGEHALPHGTATAEIDGTVTAGAYNDLEITIADCKDSGVYCDQIGVTGNMADASQISPLAGYLSNFLATNYINGSATGDEAAFLAKGVSTTAVEAVLLNTLFASAGNVTVHADTVTGSGSLTANGGAKITINNDSPDYLVLGQVRIPDLAGGHVNFSENAVVASTIASTQNNPDGASNVSITDTFASPVGNSQLGPAIFVGGSIENLGGLVEITNEHGSLGQFAPIVAQNVILNVPEGSLLIDLADGLLEPTGPNPIADWAPFMIFPGGNPKNGSNADLAIAYAVNAVYNPNFYYTNAADFTAALTFTSDPSNPITPISHFGDGKNSAGATLLTYGVCLPDNSGPTRSCNIGDNTAASPLNGYLDLCVLPGFGCGGRGVSLVPVEQLTASSTTNITAANENTTASAINANTISIKATYIDINSNISAGPPTNWSVNLSSDAATEIANDQTAYQNGSVTNPNFVLSNVGVIGAGDSLIKVTYVAGATAADGKIVVDNVLAAAQVAASIKIDGGIMSTNALGRIHVNAGLGQVQINNQTSTPITVDNISAGNPDRLGGLTGSIEIIDRLKTTGTDHYWYVYTPGQGTNVYQSSDPNATIDQASLLSSNGDTSFTYAPLPGMRWQWQQTEFLKRNITLNALGADPTVGPWYFTDPNGNSLGNNPTTPWYYTDTFDPSSAVAGSQGTLFNYGGQVLTQDPAHAGSLLMNQSESLPYMQETITGTVQFAAITAVDGGCIYLSGVHCGMQAQGNYNSFVSQKSFNSALGVYSYPSEQSFWDMAYFGSGTVTMTTSVKADNPIAVDFSGGTRGSVIINSAAPVTIDGQITNPQGDTVIASTGGDISTSTNGAVTTNNLSLDATGAVGAATNLFDTTIVGNGKLDATGDEGVYLAANGALNLAHVASSAGDVVLNAQGDITVASESTTPVITGKDVTLVAAREGDIGSTASPITLAATGTVNATADGDIVLEQTQGDLYAGSIQSIGIGSVLGDITITVDHGALLDAENTTTAQALSDDQQQKIWKALKLTTALGGGINSTTGSPTVAAVKQAINVDYTQYWTLLDHGSVTGGVYTLDSGSVSLFQTVAAAAGMTPQDYAAGLYAKVTGDFEQYVGADWQAQSAFQTQVVNFDFTPSQAVLAGLTNDGDATWTEGELKSALSLTALQPSSNTALGTTTPNISGATVTLTASNGVGSLADPVSIPIDKLTSGDLTSDQERAIALARNPGDIVFTGLDVQNNVVRFSGSIAPAGVTITGVEIQQAAPLFVAASNKFNASAQQGGVYAQAISGDLKIGSITAASGDINLAAPQNIVAADAGTTPVIQGGNITLLAGAGSIGAANAPLIYVGTTLASASAGQDISLRSYDGDMIVGRVFAGGDVSLAADGSILTSLQGVTVQADNLALQADGDIGSLTHPFAFQLAPGGVLTGSAIGDVTLVSAATASIDSFTSGGDMNIASLGDLTTTSLLSTGTMTLNAGGTLLLGRVESDFNGDHAVDITAASIAAQNGTANNLVATAANAKVYLTAETGIGAPTQYIFVDTPWISPTTVSGGIYIHALSNIALPNIAAPGELQLIADHSLTLGNVNATGALGLSAGGHLTFTDLTSGGDVALSAGNAIIGHDIVAAGSAVVTAGLGSFQISSITAADLTLTSLGDLNIPSLTINGPVLISAPNIVAHITNGSGDALAIDLTGINGAAAHSANLVIDSPQGILFGNYFVDTGVVSTNAAHVRIEHGNVANTMLLTTPFTNLFLNDNSPTPVRNVTEQLYAPGKTFFLDQDTRTTLTDAYFVAFGDGYTAQTLDRNGNIIPALSLVQVGPLPLTAPSWTRIFMQSEDGVGGLILTDPWFGSPTDFGNPDLWIVSLDGGLAVNLGGQP